MPLLKMTKTLNCSCSSKNTLLTLKDLSSKLYIEYTSDDNDLVYIRFRICA